MRKKNIYSEIINKKSVVKIIEIRQLGQGKFKMALIWVFAPFAYWLYEAKAFHLTILLQHEEFGVLDVFEYHSTVRHFLLSGMALHFIWWHLNRSNLWGFFAFL